MTREELLQRVTTNANVCGGMAVIRGTRIPVAVILDSLAEGATHERLLSAYPAITSEDILAALAYAGTLARENIWRSPAA